VSRLIAALALVLFVACTPRGAVTFEPGAATVGTVVPVFVGTTRAQDEDGTFNGKRSETLHFARLDVSVPPNREAGDITWPPRSRKADPKRDFLTTESVLYETAPGFQSDLKRQIAASGGEAVIFIHGYNSNHAEAAYRIAQFQHDLKLPAAVVLYSWPSAAEPLGYAYDRDSALFARNGLETLIQTVAKSGAKRILLIAHSMGAGPAMEALRSASIRGDTRTLSLVDGVILISPDLDVDVFREQARSIGTLPEPFIIFGSERDRYLRLSALLTGQKERLGSLGDLTRVSDLKVTFFDVGEFAKGGGHFVVGDSAALISILDRISEVEGAFEYDRRRRIGLIPGVVLTVENATQVILRPIGIAASGAQQ
jgi:esterase/lipase superfamily enzyme